MRRRKGGDQLTTLLAAGPPLERDAWALDDEGLAFVVAAIAGGRSTVIECGSGASTVVIARALRQAGRGSVSSLEHLPELAARVRALLVAEGLDTWANVIDAPLADDPVAAPDCRWYTRSALTALPGTADLLLVDGPPASGDAGAPERSRYPALPLLGARLPPDALVVLDDTDREGERWVIERWRAEFGLDMRPEGARLAAGTVGDSLRI